MEPASRPSVALADELHGDHPKSLYAAYVRTLAAARAHIEADELDRGAERLSCLAEKSLQENFSCVVHRRSASCCHGDGCNG